MQNIFSQRVTRGVISRLFGNPYLLLVLTTLFWAGNTVTARGVHAMVPPFALTWLRWTLAALIVMPMAWRHLQRDRPIIEKHWPILFLLGTLGAGLFVSLYYIGLTKTSAINAVVINSAVPILIPLTSYALYRHGVSLLQSLGIAVSLIGVLAVVTKGHPASLAILDLNSGDLWILAAMMVWALYTALLRKQPLMHWLSFATLNFLVASAVNFPLFLFEHCFVQRIQPTAEAMFAIAYIAIFPSVVAQIFYIRAVGLIGANRAGAFLHFVPMFGTVLAIVTLGERLQCFHLAGFVLILAGVSLASRPGGEPAHSSPAPHLCRDGGGWPSQ